MKKTVDQRFWEKVDKTDTCWNWTACLVRGYGSIGIRGKGVRAHRWSYERLKGPIPEGLAIDHMCKNKRCVNPQHLRAVTDRENNLCSNCASGINARKTVCKRGHPFSYENTYRSKKGRECRICRAYLKRRWDRKVRSKGTEL